MKILKIDKDSVRIESKKPKLKVSDYARGIFEDSQGHIFLKCKLSPESIKLISPILTDEEIQEIKERNGEKDILLYL